MSDTVWHELLTHEQELELSRRMRSGDQAARDELVAHNRRLVYSIARKYHSFDPATTFDDLVQEGMVGLMRAIHKFDPDRGVRFSTYAVWWIRQGIRRYCIMAGTITRPAHTVKELKGAAAQEALRRAYRPVLSLDMPLTDDEENTLLDIQHAPDSVESEVLNKIEIERILSRLRPHQQQMMLAWMEGATLAEAGRQVGRSRELVRQVLLGLRERYGESSTKE